MGLMSLIFPPRCAFCGRVIAKGQPLCEDCQECVPRIPESACRICGVEKGRCVCGKRHYPCTRRVAPFYYEGVARHGVLRFKKQGRFGGYRTLAAFVARRVKESYEDVVFDEVVCVPDSRRSIGERGFRQTALLGKEVAELLGLPFRANRLYRLYEGRPQKGMSRADRIGNVAGVFDVTCPEDVEGKRFLLIDDVITTGATVNECAKMLRIFGAAYVYVAAVCINKPPAHLKKKKKT